jgi:hypothetical protein
LALSTLSGDEGERMWIDMIPVEGNILDFLAAAT